MRTKIGMLLALATVLALGYLGSGCAGEAPTATTMGAPSPVTTKLEVTSTLGSADQSASTIATADTTPPTWTNVDVEETYRQLQADSQAQIVDVREPSEWAETGVPAGAVLIPLGELEQRAPGELLKEQPVYVICRSGNRSQIGSSTLIDLGYEEVYNVEGGIRAWLAAGLPVQSYQP